MKSTILSTSPEIKKLLSSLGEDIFNVIAAQHQPLAHSLTAAACP